MIDLDSLLDENLIDKEMLLVLNYAKLNLSEAELVLILLINYFVNNHRQVTLQLLAEHMALPKDKIDKLLNDLHHKGIITFNKYANNNIDVSNIFSQIVALNTKEKINEHNQKKIQDTKNIISTFEKEFNKQLSPMEKETIREWHATYNDEIIIYALKEAVMANVLSLRYIEKIILDQQRVLNG
jgi:DNA replication protein